MAGIESRSLQGYWGAGMRVVRGGVGAETRYCTPKWHAGTKPVLGECLHR
jgi:hypothetical protein